jgi:uncharacterized protein YegP (UPF0339 family)
MSTVHHVNLWRDDRGEWRFVPVGGNGERLDNGSEGYIHRSDAEHAARGLFGDDVEIRAI